ncbi:Molybdopterin binding protein [Cryphonectria parasitica EP155]|uniref:Molybdopterin binding protein n=1 Tax=Cryphonectria parasitica (strain ATCC 38755 / EP155) TaxID=660469 RepID=A0A9P4Y641_CRYP1|nr:Molybdopterin binding protein [Cryphonectria parasitica EP155]KAF3767401.1 Molybdopterin binding protein [Cryphonectria parasitica EP155]
MAPSTAEQNFSRTIHTAACLVIGDEVLGGKARCDNSNYMAKFCFSLGIQLKRVEVIEDDESEIIEAVRRMSDRYDFVVTSGGIGPTHDDITYQSIAKAFGLEIKLYDEAYQRMRKLSKPRPGEETFNWDEESPTKTARLRMVELPTDDSIPLEKQFLFPREDLWVPVAVVNGNVHILPGVPRLFEGLLNGLKAHIMPRLVDPEGKGACRVLISTPMGESAVAAYLTELAHKVEPQGVKVGSYPRWGKTRNTVTLVGKDQAFLDSIAPDVAQNVKGRVVKIEGEDDDLPDAA